MSCVTCHDVVWHLVMMSELQLLSKWYHIMGICTCIICYPRVYILQRGMHVRHSHVIRPIKVILIFQFLLKFLCPIEKPGCHRRGPMPNQSALVFASFLWRSWPDIALVDGRSCRLLWYVWNLVGRPWVPSGMICHMPPRFAPWNEFGMLPNHRIAQFLHFSRPLGLLLLTPNAPFLSGQSTRQFCFDVGFRSCGIHTFPCFVQLLCFRDASCDRIADSDIFTTPEYCRCISHFGSHLKCAVWCFVHLEIWLLILAPLHSSSC